MDFRTITLDDGKWARPLLAASGYHNCDYSFIDLYMWKDIYNTTIARIDDFVVFRNQTSLLSYTIPAGHGNLRKALEAVLEDAREVGQNPTFFPLDDKQRALMEYLYPGQFKYENLRDEADYIYLSSDLADLPGKKFQKKRNHCSRFERLYDGQWEFKEITPDALDDVCAFNKRWSRLYDNRGDEGIEEEYQVIRGVCNEYEAMDLKGGYITVNGEVVAFSFGSPLGKDMFITHVEKALYDVSGAYNIINREMARAFCRGYTYINRENDVGEEGLRAAKLSYNPVRLEEKYSAEFIPGGRK